MSLNSYDDTDGGDELSLADIEHRTGFVNEADDYDSDDTIPVSMALLA